MTRRVWLDVEDVFEYAAYNARPSGIQRLQMELCRALVALDPSGDRIGFLRHAAGTRSFRPVAWRTVEALFDRLSGAASARGTRDAAPPRDPVEASAARAGARRLLHRLPPRIRQPLISYLLQQRQAFSSLRAMARACVARPVSLAETLAPGQAPPPADGVGPGDLVLVLGAAWYHPGYAELVRAGCLDRGARFGLLLYDIIPLRRPEWCDRGLVRIFGTWFHSVVGLADLVFSISRSSGSDIEAYAAAHGPALRGPVHVLPIGSGFTGGEPAPSSAKRPTVEPIHGDYALVVATLEARKNHALLLRVWRRLLDEMPREQVPTLVLAGRVGWLVADLMQQLRNCDFLDGKIVLVEDPSDADLEWLYRGCRFTLFPSFSEGWGLPVTESLAFGRPCIASNATSLPEAGGTLARYFDPENAAEAYRVVREVLSDPAGLAEWRRRIAREFRPVPWQATAAALLDRCVPTGEGDRTPLADRPAPRAIPLV